MTFKEIAEQIDNGKDIVICCDTEEKAQDLLSMCKAKGFRWRGGLSISYRFNKADAAQWQHNKQNTVYYIRTSQNKTITYGHTALVGGMWHYAENDDEEICLGGYDISFLLN